MSNSLPRILPIKIQIDDISQQELDVKVTGKINTQSERLVEFLKRAPLDESVHEVLNSINLSGKVNKIDQVASLCTL
jgi:uncharacterized protein YhdP